MTKVHSMVDDIDYAQFFMAVPSPHLIIRPDKDLTVVAQNDAHAKIALVKKGTIIGLPLLTAFPDTSQKYIDTGVSDLAESFRTVARTGKPDPMPLLKYDLRDKKGVMVERWWRVTHYPIFDKNGAVALVYQVTEDITNEVAAKAELARTETMLKSVQELDIVSTFSWDMKEDIVVGDANLAKTFGVTQQQAKVGLPLQSFIDSIHPEDRLEVNDAISKAVNEGSNYQKDYRTIRFDKSIGWVSAAGKIVPDEDGKAHYFNGILIDITERKLAEARSVQAEQRFNALFNANIVAIALANLDGSILQANNTFLNLFGYTKADLKKGLHSSTVSFVHNDNSTKTIYESLQKNGQAEPIRKEYVRKDGTNFTGIVGAVMLPDSESDFLAFILDISETEKLKELNIVKDEFIAMASHQLRTPASTVKQYLGILMAEYAGPLNEDQLQYANIANDANEREIKIIEDLLKTAKIDVKGYNLELRPINIVKLVQDVITECKQPIENRKQSLLLSSSSPVIIVRADATELSTSLINLIENASKYSEHDTKINIDIVQHNKNITIAVTDKGVGIAEGDFEKILDKFTRVDNPLSDTVTGSGLGLYWVKRIVELHGGKLSIKSKLGKGTTFTILLPI